MPRTGFTAKSVVAPNAKEKRMTWLKIIWAEFIGLFVDDGSFAIAILSWLGAWWLILPRLELPTFLPPAILFVGLILVLAESAVRRAGQRP
jgi:hypothetical protein